LQLIAVLMLVTLGLIIAAYYAHKSFYGDISSLTAGTNSFQKERLAEYLEESTARIKPVSAFLAGDAGMAEMRRMEEARLEALKGQCAYDCTKDPTVIYQKLCGACHISGAGGAPRSDDKAAWAPRIAQGMDTLVKHAIEGFQGQGGLMPARGGNPTLTDEQIQLTVQYMVDKVK
jgi:cytochrome c5